MFDLVVLVISALERQRQVDPWGSLATQPNVLGEFQINEGPCFKNVDGTEE